MFNLTERQSRIVLSTLFKLKRAQKVLNMSDYATIFIKNKYTLLLFFPLFKNVLQLHLLHVNFAILFEAFLICFILGITFTLYVAPSVISIRFS